VNPLWSGLLCNLNSERMQRQTGSNKLCFYIVWRIESFVGKKVLLFWEEKRSGIKCDNIKHQTRNFYMKRYQFAFRVFLSLYSFFFVLDRGMLSEIDCEETDHFPIFSLNKFLLSRAATLQA